MRSKVTPAGLLRMAARAEKLLYYCLAGLTAACVAVLVLLVAAQIISRELSMVWLAPPDELVTLFFAWLVFMGIAAIQRDRGHLSVELAEFVTAKRPALKKALGAVLDLFMLVFSLVMLRSGLFFYALGGIKISPTLGWSERIWYLPLPLSAALMLLYTLIHLAGLLSKSGRDQADSPAGPAQTC